MRILLELGVAASATDRQVTADVLHTFSLGLLEVESLVFRQDAPHREVSYSHGVAHMCDCTALLLSHFGADLTLPDLSVFHHRDCLHGVIALHRGVDWDVRCLKFVLEGHGLYSILRTPVGLVHVGTHSLRPVVHSGRG